MNREDIIRMAREVSNTPIDHHATPELFGVSQIERFAALVAAAERNKLAAWMIQFGFATGHGDTMEQLVDALGSEIVDRIEIEIDCEREACAQVCEVNRYEGYVPPEDGAAADYYNDASRECAAAIRARGETK